MPYNLGVKPDRLKVFLYRDADFDSALTRRDEAGVAIPWGTADVRLYFPVVDVTWNAVVDEAVATFQVDKAESNLRANSELVELWVGDQCWAAGKVTKRGALP